MFYCNYTGIMRVVVHNSTITVPTSALLKDLGLLDSWTLYFQSPKP